MIQDDEFMQVNERNMKILIIGAGPTSALLAYNLKKIILKEIIDIHVWEKASSIGGRFQTFVSPTELTNTADLGAQYLSQSLNQSWSNSYFQELEKAQLIKKIETASIPGFKQDEAKKHFVCPSGACSIVKYYFEKACMLDKVRTNRKVAKVLSPVSHIGQSSQNKVTVQAESGLKEEFDIIISTIPVPELLSLENIGELINGKSDLLKVSYTSRFALGLFFHDKQSSADVSSYQPFNFARNLQSPIRYWSLENLKRAAGDHKLASYQFPAIVVHTSVDYGAKNINESETTVRPYLLDQLKLETHLVNDSSKYTTICHKWKYSQVLTPYPNSPGYVILHQSPIILGAGDSFSYSGFEGCVSSAQNTAKYIQSILT